VTVTVGQIVQSTKAMRHCSCVISLPQLGLILTISLLPIVYFSFSLPTIPRHFESACLTDPDSKVHMSLHDFINEHKRRHHEKAFRAHWHPHHADHTSDGSAHHPNQAGGHGPNWHWRRGHWGAAAYETRPDRHDLRGR
jgi:hypothetical protein